MQTVTQGPAMYTFCGVVSVQMENKEFLFVVVCGCRRNESQKVSRVQSFAFNSLCACNSLCDLQRINHCSAMTWPMFLCILAPDMFVFQNIVSFLSACTSHEKILCLSLCLYLCLSVSLSLSLHSLFLSHLSVSVSPLSVSVSV